MRKYFVIFAVFVLALTIVSAVGAWHAEVAATADCNGVTQVFIVEAGTYSPGTAELFNVSITGFSWSASVRWSDSGEVYHFSGTESRPDGCDEPENPPTEVPPCETCVLQEVQPITCINYLLTEIDKIFVDGVEIHNWKQSFDAEKLEVVLVLGDAHRTAKLDLVLKNGDHETLVMRPGWYYEFKDTAGNIVWFQNGCERLNKVTTEAEDAEEKPEYVTWENQAREEDLKVLILCD